MIEKLNLHYSFTNPASIHDEEALTALELAGRQGAKINEVVNDQNNLRTETETHLEAQDKDIDNQKKVVIPATIENEVRKHINSGTFDAAIDEYAGALENRVDALLKNLPVNSTTMDAEVIDCRTGADGRVYNNAGEALRTQTNSLMRPVYLRYQANAFIKPETLTFEHGYRAKVHFDTDAEDGIVAIGFTHTLEPNKNYTAIIESSNAAARPDIYLTDAIKWGNGSGVTVEKTSRVIKGFTTYINFRYTYSTKQPDFLLLKAATVPGTAGSVSVSVIPNLETTEAIKLFDRPVLIKEAQYIGNTSSPAINDGYGRYTVEIPVNNHDNGKKGFVITKPAFEVGKTYRLRIRFVNPATFVSLYYKDAANWNPNTGYEAPMLQHCVAHNDREMSVYFKITENTANASVFMGRFATDAAENGYSFEVSEIFAHDFTPEQQLDTYIAFIGDSLTAQGYYDHINAGAHKKVGYGVGGEGIHHIYNRTGIVPWRCNNDTIVSGANILDTTCPGLFTQGMGNVNPVTIAGIVGTLSVEDNNLVFTPNGEIEETPVYNAEIIPSICSLNAVCYVLWAGTNNMSTSTAEEIVESWKQFINVHPNSLILGLTKDENADTLAKIAATNNLGYDVFGSRFVDVHTWVKKYGLQYNGITPTSADTAAIAAGKIPPSLLADPVHFNEAGRKAVAHLVEERLKKVGVL